MDNNELNNSPELEQLRADYEILKKSFSQQEVINSRIMRQTMRQKVNGINKTSHISTICGVFVAIMAPFIFHYNPVVQASWVFVAVTIVMMLISIYANWKYNHKLNDINLSSCDLKEFAKNVKYTKDKWHKWIKFAIPMVILWFSWLVVEVWAHSDDKELSMFLIFCLAAGGIIGAVLGLKMHRKVVDNCDDILDQIEA